MVNPLKSVQDKASAVAAKAKELHVKMNTPPPPPKVFGCIVLKRTPALTPEDEPPVDSCQKLLMKLFLIPVALFVWAYGIIVWLLLQLMRLVLLPCLGPLFVQTLALSAMTNDRQAVQEQAGCGIAIVKWWVLTYMWVLSQCLSPIFRIWMW